MSKSFDRVWHKGLPYKTEQCVIKGILLLLLSTCLTDSNQKVLINSIQFKISLLTVTREMNITIIQIEIHQSPNPNRLICHSQHII